MRKRSPQFDFAYSYIFKIKCILKNGVQLKSILHKLFISHYMTLTLKLNRLDFILLYVEYYANIKNREIS